jgi:glycolate oxidase
MHPIILFDARRPGDLEKTKAAGEEILAHCISVGGSITGEHGVGMEKNEMMDRLFSKETLGMMRDFKLLFDPDGRLNPGKVLPTEVKPETGSRRWSRSRCIEKRC